LPRAQNGVYFKITIFASALNNLPLGLNKLSISCCNILNQYYEYPLLVTILIYFTHNASTVPLFVTDPVLAYSRSDMYDKGFYFISNISNKIETFGGNILFWKIKKVYLGIDVANSECLY